MTLDRKMSLIELKDKAEDDMVDGDMVPFDLCGPTGKVRCKWIDPFFGIFERDGSSGFSMVANFKGIPDLYVEEVKD